MRVKLRRYSLLLVLFDYATHLRFSTDAQRTEAFAEVTPRSTSRKPLNLLVINDEENEIANRSVTNALKDLTKEPDLLLGEVTVVQLNRSDPRGALDLVCAAWDGSLARDFSRVPDLVLDVTTHGPGSETVHAFAAALAIPTLSARFGQQGDLRQWRDLNETQMRYLVQVMPPADLLPESVRQLAIAMNVTNAAILFDGSFVMDHKYKSLLQNVPVRHVIAKAKDPGRPMISQLQRLRDLDIVNFFVLGAPETLSETLNAAQSLNFTGRKYSWHALTLEEANLECDCANISVVFLKPTGSENQQAVGELSSKGLLPKPILTSAFYYDLTRLGVTAMRAAIDEASSAPSTGETRRGITCAEYNGNNAIDRRVDLLSHLKNVTVGNIFKPTYANFTWGEANGQHHASFTMAIAMVTIANSNPVSTEEIGSWDAGIDRELQLTSEDMIANHTAVTSYRVVTVVQAPFVMYDPESDKWSGYCIDLLEEIRSILHFEYEIREADDQMFGNIDNDGNWNGMVKELMEKRADIGLGSLSVMAERENVIDFTVPYYDLVGITILMKKPKTPTSLFKFLTVLENDVWLCILAAYFFTSFLMWVFDRWSPYSYQNNREKYKDDEEKREFNLKECLWFCMTSLTPQGGGEAPKNLSGRLVAATWWLFGFIIIASYTANLAAFLTVSRLDTPVESLDDLSKQYKIQYAPLNGSAAHTYFQRMKDIEKRFYEIWKDMSLNDSLSDVERSKLAVWDYPVSDKYVKMYQAMKEAGFPSNMSEALARVRSSKSTSEGFAFIGDATDIKYLTLTNCDLDMVGEEFSRKPYAIAVQQGSPLKDEFNMAILTLLNKRRLEKLKDKWWNQNPLKKVCEKQDDQSDGISIQNIGGVFIVIFVGIGLACLTLAFEYWWYRFRPKAAAATTERSKGPQSVKPVRFYLQPAAASSRHAIPPAKFQARF